MENGGDNQNNNLVTGSQPVTSNNNVVNPVGNSVTNVTQPSATSFGVSTTTTNASQPVVSPVQQPVIKPQPVVAPAPVAPQVQTTNTPSVSVQPQVVNPLQSTVNQPVNVASTAPVQEQQVNPRLNLQPTLSNITTFKSGERDYLTKRDETKVQINSSGEEKVKSEEIDETEMEEENVTGINNKASVILTIIFTVFLISGLYFIL